MCKAAMQRKPGTGGLMGNGERLQTRGREEKGWGQREGWSTSMEPGEGRKEEKKGRQNLAFTVAVIK